MKSLARGIFLLTILSCILIFLAWIIPCWFGRVYGNNVTKTLWGLFYVIECTSAECISISRSLRNANVDFSGATPPLRVEAISVLATLSFILSLCGMVHVVIFHCHSCGRRYDYKNYVFSAVLVQIIQGTFVFLTIVLSAVSNGVFFSKSRMKNADEFPWSLFLFCVAEVMLVTSIIILLLITCRWKKYRHIYTKHHHHHSSHSTAIEPYKRYEETIPDYRIESYEHYRPHEYNRPHDYYRPQYDYQYGGYNDHIVPVNSGYYDKGGLPYKSMFGRTRYYITQPYKNDYMDYSYVADRQCVPYYTAHSGLRSNLNTGLHNYMPVSSGLWHTPGVLDNAVVRRNEPMFVNEPILYTNDFHNRNGQLYYH